MKDLLFIINPIAGKGGNKNFDKTIERIFKDSGKSYDCIYTDYAKHAIKLAQNNAADYKLIVAVGGDGTINEVATGLLSRGVKKFGMIPSGTGNDLARMFTFKGDLLNTFDTEDYDTLDLIKSSEDDTILNIASFGLDSYATILARNYKRKFNGSIAYLIGTVEAIFRYRKKHIKLTIDGNTSEYSLVLCAFGNGQKYGSNIPICPWAVKDDGYIHGVVIENFSNLSLLMLLPTIFTGTFTNYRNVTTFKCKKLIVEPLDSGLYFNIDGDTREFKRPLHFSIEEKALKIKI